MRRASFLALPFVCAACASSGASSTAAADKTAEDTVERATAGASSERRSPAGSSSSAPDAGGDVTDLSRWGLPITIRLPRCRDGSAPKIAEPAVKVADNASDRVVSCDASDADAFAGRPAFAVVVGPAAGKISKKEIQEDPNFVKLVSDDPKSLEWQSKSFDRVVSDFLLRVTVGGKEYACSPQFELADEKLYRAELDACRSIAAK
jgi:hypothetical protein